MRVPSLPSSGAARRLLLLLLLVTQPAVLPATVGGPAAPPVEDEAEDRFAGLEYRLVGPAAGGRVARVTGVPGDPLTYFAATASGGVWRSTNGGTRWEPVFDDQPMLSTGAIAVAPSDPNVVYVGAGEANIRGNVVQGDGIYKSVNGGTTWERVFEQTGQIATLAVHPRNPEVAFAAVVGHAFGPNPERGVYRTLDGGATWEQVLAKDADTGASDVALHPANPRVLFAGLWQVRRLPWGMTSGGPGSGLWTSRDGGDTWTELGPDSAGEEAAGLPAKPWGRVGVRFAPSDPRRVYALIEAEEGGLFRSDDGGESWERVSASRGLRQRAWYYTTLTVDPRDADTVWFPQVSMQKTIDGGATVRSVAAGGWDYHDVWIDPEDPRRILVGSDAGVSLSRDGGETWEKPPLPISQVYHVATDSRLPYRVMATLQDWGTASGPSNSLHGGGIHLSDWHGVGGGEAGHLTAVPDDPHVVYAGEYLGVITRYDDRTGEARNVSVYPWNGSGHPAGDLEYRFQWTAPIVASRHDPQVIYHAANVLFRSEDGGQSWQAISPDLTRDDESKQGWAGGPITGDNTGVEFYGTIFAVAESPLDAGLIWVGSDDGRIHLTRDGGGSWTEVTAHVPGLPEWGTVAGIEPSAHDAGTAYLVVDAHRLDDPRPYLWKTSDHGATWQPITAGLPEDVHLRVVREDPARPGLLYLGSDRGLWLSPDGGETWRSLRLNLPPVPVADLRVHQDGEGDDLVVGTQGRSIWILDDLTPVRELAAGPPAEAVHLFPPPPAVAWSHRDAMGSGAGAGENPPYGALLSYWLAEAPPDGEAVTLEVFDDRGRLVRTLDTTLRPLPLGPEHPDWPPDWEEEPELTTEAGLQRASWDLTWDGADYVPGMLFDWGDPGAGPRALPGQYTLRLTAAGETSETTVTVHPDPRAAVPRADLEAQLAFGLELRDDLGRVNRAVERLWAIRSQVELRTQLLADRRDGAGPTELTELVEMGEALVARLDALEARLHNPEAEVTYDVLAGRGGGAQLYSQLAPLYDFAISGAGAPTQGMREVAAEHRATLVALEGELEALVTEDLAELNRRAAELGVPYVHPGV